MFAAWTTDTQWRHKLKKSENKGLCGRQSQNLLWPQFWIGSWFLAAQWRRFPHRASVVCGLRCSVISYYEVIWVIIPHKGPTFLRFSDVNKYDLCVNVSIPNNIDFWNLKTDGVFLKSQVYMQYFTMNCTGISWFILLMWGHIKNRGKGTLRKSRLLNSTKGEENRIEL